MSLFLWSLFSPPVNTHLCRKYRRIGLKNSRRLVLIHRRRKKKFAFFSALFFSATKTFESDSLHHLTQLRSHSQMDFLPSS